MDNSFIEEFEQDGFVTYQNMLSPSEIKFYRNIYEDFLNNKISTEGHRSDLSGSKGKKELIVQIMHPSMLHPSLLQSTLHQKVSLLAKTLLGQDMELDFDMLIDKPPFTNKETPFHQDEAYWIDMEDKRAVSCWVALDDVTKENGCMWYVPGSHLGKILPHIQTGNGGALKCESSEAEAQAVEIQAGSCTFHHGRTIHYARGNSTKNRRRAFILNFRPKDMIEFERANGFNHLGERKLK